jgi:hypothetical protein
MTGSCPFRFTLRANPVFDLYLGMKRQITPMKHWEIVLLPPSCADEQVRLFADGMAMVAAADFGELDARVAGVRSTAGIRDLVGSVAGWDKQHRRMAESGLDKIACSLEQVGNKLAAAIARHSPQPEAALGGAPTELAAPLAAGLELTCRRLGIRTIPRGLEVLLAPFTPFGLPCEVISTADDALTCYTDYRVFRGGDFCQATLSVLAVALGARSVAATADDAPLWERIASAVSQVDRQRQALSRILMIVLANLTAAHAARVHIDPSHADNAERLGIYQRYRRLTAVIAPAWRQYLNGADGASQAVDAITRLLRDRPADYYIAGEPVDQMIADFYLLEFMSAEGNPIARRLLGRLEAALAEDFVRYLHIAIGAELGHYQATPLDTLPDELREFVAGVNAGDSRLRWPELYAAYGIRALFLAEDVFLHSGPEFGGRAWAPITVLLRDYLSGTINRRIFIDQCFSIKHNNGPIFDKIYDVSGVGPALAAQAAGDLARLSGLASQQVRYLYRRALVLRRLEHDPVWLGVQQDSAADVAAWEDKYGWRERPRQAIRTPRGPGGKIHEIH